VRLDMNVFLICAVVFLAAVQIEVLVSLYHIKRRIDMLYSALQQLIRLVSALGEEIAQIQKVDQNELHCG
jgi:hypothetical protein